jgi:predicted metal-dependent hydrolase
MATETLELAALTFEVRRSARRHTLGITVDRGGELVVHAPDSLERPDLERWVKGKLLWVHQRLLEKAKTASEQYEPGFVGGESFCYLGRHYRLRTVSRQDAPLRLEGGWFVLRQKEHKRASEVFRAWFIEAGTPWLTERVEFLSPRIGVKPERIEVRDLGFRWGSCGKHNALFFNWRLMQLPVHLVDYVILHEMTHLVEPHHGPAFWARLERALPDWRERKDELSVAAREYVQFTLPARPATRRRESAITGPR